MADRPEQWAFFYFYDPEQPAGCFWIETHAEASPPSHKKSLKTVLERLQACSTGQVECDHGEIISKFSGGVGALKLAPPILSLPIGFRFFASALH
ncbi:hypothetical protein NDU88_006749 [Pleurodeles waltl]|uniref:Uncharacterized protein n=1 Tax=Pleurodeles waltl TaxID=8319 RepID=A0AAV7RR07_PLEWA|nr:hypothetical protein NDU88_006749 [Pleurodeles waltl]